jgi:hypothetical protein
MFVLSEDIQQRIKATLILLYTGVRTILATLLSIFVHQLCPNIDGIYKECSIIDNFTDLTQFNLLVIIFNFITLIFFIGFYILEFYRENVCIKYLDIDVNLPNINLKKEIEEYPKIENKLNKLNKHYCNFSYVLLFMNIINFILSVILINQYYGGYKTIISIITNILLIVDKIYTAIYISRKSVLEILPYSAYMKDYIIFNTIDKQYKQHKLHKNSKNNMNFDKDETNKNGGIIDNNIDLDISN